MIPYWLFPWTAKREIERLHACLAANLDDSDKYVELKCDHSLTLSQLKSAEQSINKLEAELEASKVAHKKIKQWIIVTHGLSSDMRTSGKPVDILDRKNSTLGMKEK